jgi:DNA-binding winged helix-turn-helix (wHTH) protein
MSRPPSRLLRFGAFEMDLEARELRRRGRLVPLPPQLFAVLAELATRSGRVVPREELQALLWGDGVHVDRARGLNHCLNRIRRVLGDDARLPRFVETVPRQGYRFLASVQAVELDLKPPSPPAPVVLCCASIRSTPSRRCLSSAATDRMLRPDRPPRPVRTRSAPAMGRPPGRRARRCDPPRPGGQPVCRSRTADRHRSAP